MLHLKLTHVRSSEVTDRKESGTIFGAACISQFFDRYIDFLISQTIGSKKDDSEMWVCSIIGYSELNTLPKFWGLLPERKSPTAERDKDFSTMPKTKDVDHPLDDRGFSLTSYPMGPLEKIMCHVYDHFDGDGVGGVSVHIEGVLLANVLSKALDILQMRHPKLRCGIGRGEDGRSYCFRLFDSAPRIPLETFNYTKEEPPWEEEVGALLSKKYNLNTGPLCNVKLLKNEAARRCVLMIAAHHAIIDALCLTILLDEILILCEWIQNNTENKIMEGGKPIQLPFVTATRFSLTATVWQKLQVALKLAGFLIRKKRGTWGRLPGEGSRNPPRWVRTQLSKEETTELVARCKEEKTTIFGTVSAAAVASLSELVGTDFRIALRCAIDARHYVGIAPGDPHIGCFASGFDKVYAYGKNTSFWEFARRTRKDVQDFIAKQGPVMALRLIKFMRLPYPGKVRRDTLGINNLGVGNLNDHYGGLRPQALSHFISNRNIGVSLMIILCTLNGKLNITFGSVDVDSEFRRRFQNTFLKKLHAVVTCTER